MAGRRSVSAQSLLAKEEITEVFISKSISQNKIKVILPILEKELRAITNDIINNSRGKVVFPNDVANAIKKIYKRDTL